MTFPRPGKQFDLIDLAVAPLERPPGAMEPGRLTQLKHDLAVIMSAEALFTLTDLAGLAPHDAIAECRAHRTDRHRGRHAVPGTSTEPPAHLRRRPVPRPVLRHNDKTRATRHPLADSPTTTNDH